jgi:UDP-glucose 4-epimerase
MVAPAASGEIYNVGAQQPIRILDLARRVIELTRSESELAFVPHAEVYGQGIEDMYHRIPATDKIEAAVGWKASRDLDTILADVIEDARTRIIPVERQTAAAAKP